MFSLVNRFGSRIVQPFRIICETCRSRLKIRSADVIGQIHACPKCGSMVQIVPPAGWDPNAMAMAEQSNAAGDASLSLSTTASLIIPASAIDDLSAAAATLEAPAFEVPVKIAPSSVLPPAVAGSTAKLWALGGVAAAVLLGGLTLAVWPSGSENVVEPPPTTATKSDHQLASEQSAEPKPATPSVEQSKAKATDADAIPAKSEATQVTQTANPKPAAEQVAVDSASKVAKPAEPAVPTPSPAAEKSDKANATDSPKAAIAEPAKTNGTPAPAPKAAEALSKAPDHSPVLKFDPLDFDVDRLGANGKTLPDSTASTNSVPDKLPGETAVVSVAEQSMRPVAGDTALPLVANNGVKVRRGPPADAPQRTAGQALAARVKSFQVTEMPLVRFVETISGVAGIGITLDPIALEQVGISPQATVSANAQDAPLQSILHDGLAQRRLDIAVQGGQLRVVLPNSDEPHPIDCDVKDLAASTDAAAVGHLIEHFVAPTTWQSAGGKGTLQASGTTLHIEQSDSVRRQVVVFCERLRLARGLAVQSKYPAALLSVESPYQHLSAKLSEHTTFTFLPWTRLDDVARNWQELSGLMVLVDWAALDETELGPSSPVACSANDRPWQDSLDGVLEPLGLGWWAVSGEAIQITSLAALNKIQRVEFYGIPAKLRSSFASNQALIDSLQKEFADGTGKSVQPHMEIDQTSGRLIILATPSLHRHLSSRLSSAKPQ